MELLDTLNKYWFLILSFTGMIYMVARTEGNDKAHEEKINLLETKFAVMENKQMTLESTMVQDISKVKESLARIEGALTALGHLKNND